jgi:bifunctional DNA-binding transcriptional regulator/antitoxin component of YhaV-PrlF toxin-antitoxin module
MNVRHKRLLMVVGPDLHDVLVRDFGIKESTTLVIVRADEDHRYFIEPTNGNGNAVRGQLSPVQWMSATRYIGYDRDEDILYIGE